MHELVYLTNKSFTKFQAYVEKCFNYLNEVKFVAACNGTSLGTARWNYYLKRASICEQVLAKCVRDVRQARGNTEIEKKLPENLKDTYNVVIREVNKFFVESQSNFYTYLAVLGKVFMLCHKISRIRPGKRSINGRTQ